VRPEQFSHLSGLRPTGAVWPAYSTTSRGARPIPGIMNSGNVTCAKAKLSNVNIPTANVMTDDAQASGRISGWSEDDSSQRKLLTCQTDDDTGDRKHSRCCIDEQCKRLVVEQAPVRVFADRDPGPHPATRQRLPPRLLKRRSQVNDTPTELRPVADV
jgi:hypothetical protein